ncbi:MAG: SulP family inorganic anion transporter [Anaerolineae bacterium]|nr:SulP family inorganic anion transporter [Anaerolineae bacterium]
MEQIRTRAQRAKPDRENLSSDLVAGLTFAVVNVPQAMAHALLATVNPVLGIYTLMIAVPIGAVFTSSVFMNVSTTSAMSVATGAGLYDVPDSMKTEAVAVLVLLVGAIQLLAGLFRLGFVVRFVSNAVMTGFLNGVAVLIILGQLGELTGYQSVYTNNVARAMDLFLHLDQISLPTTVIGLLTLALIVLFLGSAWRKFAFIIGILLSTVLLAILTLPQLGMILNWNTVRTVGDVSAIPRALPQLSMPSLGLIVTMLLPALAVAIIGLIQGAGVSQGYPNPDGKYPNVSRDFLGQGAANLATAFVGGIPAGGSISGTALVMGAGARSRWTNISAGIFVAAVVLLLAPLVELVPMPSLAALLIVAGYQGLRIPAATTIWNTGKFPAAVMGLTFLATLFMPLQYAVLVGVAFSILLYVIRQSNQVVMTQWVLVPGGLPEERPAPAELPSHHFTILQVYGSLFFAAAKNLEEMLPRVDNTTRAAVALGLRGRTEIGSTFITVLERYAGALKERDSRLMLVGIDRAVYEQLARTGVLKTIGEENIFFATPQLGTAMNRAAAAAYAWLGESPVEPALTYAPPSKD